MYISAAATLAPTEHRSAEQELRTALTHSELVLHYQPILDLATNHPVGAEALIRWAHPTRGLLSPAAFPPAARHSNLVTRIGGWVLRTACNEAAGWHSHGVVSVNVAARQLADGVLLDQVHEALDLSEIAPPRLQLEFTEAMLVNLDIDAVLTLSAIRDLGVGIVLDNVGTGHFNPATLARLPLTGLKLDRTVIRDLPDRAPQARLAHDVVDLGHTMDLSVTAVGIETPAQLAALVGIGFDLGQGFLFGK